MLPLMIKSFSAAIVSELEYFPLTYTVPHSVFS